MPNLGPMEIIAVLMVALVVLGPKRLPEAGRQVGRALGEVKKWSSQMQAEVKNVLDTDPEFNPDAEPKPEPTALIPPPEAAVADVEAPDGAQPK